jgi:hypothetical protein
MKSLLVISALISFASNAFTQTNNFAPIGAKWWYNALAYCGGTGFECGYFTLESIKDTIILDKTCRVIKEEHFEVVGEYPIQFHYIYEDSNKVYFYNEDEFNLLYNFAAIQNDTISVINHQFSGFFPFEDILYENFTYIIDSVSTTSIDGIDLKVQFPREFPNIDSWGFSYPQIIEKIGATSLFFGQPNIGPLEYGSFLRCYEDATISYTDFVYPCDYVTTIKSNIVSESIKVYPNPASTFVEIIFTKPDQYSIEVIDLLGRSINVIDKPFEGTSYRLDISHISENLFFIKIKYGMNEKYFPIFKI